MTAALDKFNAIYPEEIKKYKIDAVIVGSDIVWNICDENYKKNMFYGKGLPCDVTCFAYAPSAGNAKYEDFNSYHEQKEGIKDIKIIGVRDENTAEIVKKISGVKPELVCDPTMLINVEEYNVNKARLLNDKFLLVYAYYVSDKYRIYLKRYARKKGFKLVSVCMYHRWCDINLVCHPLEFSSLINQAECVFTSTFHGSIFTLLNHKPCAILASSKKGCDLLKWTAMEEVRIKDDIEYKEFELLLNRQPDYIKFEQALDIRRMKSRNLYISAMQEISNGRDM